MSSGTQRRGGDPFPEHRPGSEPGVMGTAGKAHRLVRVIAALLTESGGRVFLQAQLGRLGKM